MNRFSTKMRIIRVVTICIKSSFGIAYDDSSYDAPALHIHYCIKIFKSTSSGNASIQPTKRDDPSGVGGIGHRVLLIAEDPASLWRIELLVGN